MNRKLLVSLAMVASLALIAGAASAGENVWVSDDGKTHKLHSRGHAMFIGDDGEAFDLSELADGETRVFGTGDKQVTASRDGDTATIYRAATDEKSELEITCLLTKDTCKIATAGDDSDQVFIIVEKTRECVNGEGDCDHDLTDLRLGDGSHTIVIRKTVECDDEGNCTESEDANACGEAHGYATIQLETASAGAGEGVVIVGEGDHMLGGHAKGNVFFISEDSKVSLRCPEGDTTMRVEKEEAEDVFLCPKHSLPLEKVETKGRVHEIKVRTKEESK